MTKISKALLVLGSAAILSGCGSKTTFAKFKEAAGKVKAHEYTKCVVKMDGNKYEGKLGEVDLVVVKIKGWVSDSSDAKVVNAYIVVNEILTADTVKLLEEDKEATYYVNNLGMAGAKEGEYKSRIEWNKYGLVTSYSFDDLKDDNNDMKFTVSYSK